MAVGVVAAVCSAGTGIEAAGMAVGESSQPTSEVFTDPATGKPMRVWYNPTTGEREYRPE